MSDDELAYYERIRGRLDSGEYSVATVHAQLATARAPEEREALRLTLIGNYASAVAQTEKLRPPTQEAQDIKKRLLDVLDNIMKVLTL